MLGQVTGLLFTQERETDVLINGFTVVYVPQQAEDLMLNPNSLSTESVLFRNGGDVNGKEASPYVKLDDRIKAAIRLQLAKEEADAHGS